MSNMGKEQLQRATGEKRDWLSILVILSFIALVISIITIPGFRKAPERANQRACYANQKTLAGAIEMYEVDSGKSHPVLDEKLFQQLLKEKYLIAIPNDPGDGENSHSNYHRIDGELFCLRHGSIQGLNGNSTIPPRQELIAAGISDKQLINKAANKFPTIPSWKKLHIDSFPLFLSIFIVISGIYIIRTIFRWIASAYRFVKTGAER